MNPEATSADRRYFIGGSDARIIMGNDEARPPPPLAGEARRSQSRRTCPATSSSSSGLATEDLNRRWYEANTGRSSRTSSGRSGIRRFGGWRATLDGRVEATGAVFEAKFMLPWSFSEEAAAEKYMPQLQHNMWVVAAEVGGALSDHRRRQVGGDQDPCRSALSAPHRYRRAEILALRRERRTPSPVRGRAAEGRASRRCALSI